MAEHTVTREPGGFDPVGTPPAPEAPFSDRQAPARRTDRLERPAAEVFALLELR